MHDSFPSLSTDQVASFVELARQGTLSGAAEALIISEQGLRNRVLALERQLKVPLYHKARGPRRGSLLTVEGQRFLPLAIDFLDRARALTDLFAGHQQRTIHVAATQYLILYVMIDAVRRFHSAYPQIQVRLSNRIEQEIEQELLGSSDVEVGVAAPYERSPVLEYTHLFSMPWSLITPPGHPLLARGRLTWKELADQPLILYERGSTGRQHVMEAFQAQGLSPRVETETTNTEIIVRMVEAGLGVSIVPLLASGEVTRNRRVGVRGLGGRFRPIQSGILTRRGMPLSAPSQTFVDFVRCQFAAR
ncbi:MAG: LysR family transcriptional regulator [Pirellulaceae bacterium]|nr:LysR family transcriptional regulator [Pirellulaceae bacterium]